MINNEIEYTGLTSREAAALQLQYGKNELASQKKEPFIIKALHIISEPMFLLLIIAAVIYFILGEPLDGLIMLIFVICIICIEIVQEWRTDKTLNALKDLSPPFVNVLRDGREIEIAGINLVPGDVMMVHEGQKISADGMILRCSDLSIDESTLTGEAENVEKISAENAGNVENTENMGESEDYWRKDYCYAGTYVTHGTAVVLVDKIGASTEYGRIGTHIAVAPKSDTLLQKQTDSLVKLCSVIAAALFVLVGIVTYLNIPDHDLIDRIIESILSGITLAMAMIPEEFPVILTVFLSMGAWRLAKKQSLVRSLPSVETLGAVSVLCVDKTGTITMNQMTVQDVWAPDGNNKQLCEIMGLACETDAYDPMEKAMLEYCEAQNISRSHLFGGDLIDEYAFTNELKMMGHVWRHEGEIIIAAKGSPEQVLAICNLRAGQRDAADNKTQEMSEEGLRVIAVAVAGLPSESAIPETITACELSFCGLIGLADPPRDSVKGDIAVCKHAGVRVVMITGDNGVTASSIAKKIGMENPERIITGDMLEAMSDEELRLNVTGAGVFSRVIPEHKMRIVKALKDNGEVVAMTGDGVNDAPALKYADIGIAMGKRGSEVSREAADLILMDDNFSTIVDTIKDGRRIYDNIRKAVGYVFTIHIPIALTSLLAPLLGINPANLMLLPLHVVLLELIIDPTCSVVLERQPAERNIMERGPRDPHEKLLNAGTLAKAVIQGLVIFAASFGLYYYTMARQPGNGDLARSMGLAVIMLANLFLVQVNSSDTDYAIVSLISLAKDKVMQAVNVLTVLALLAVLYTPLGGLLSLAPLSVRQFLTVSGFAAVSVLWYEIVKFIRKTVSRIA